VYIISLKVLQQQGNKANSGVTKQRPIEEMAANPPYVCFSYGKTKREHPGQRMGCVMDDSVNGGVTNRTGTDTGSTGLVSAIGADG
jgi:hypothetical protein